MSDSIWTARPPKCATPWTRASIAALVAVAAAAAASTVWLVHPWYEASGSTNDASMYLRCTQALVSGEGYSYLGRPFTLRPPGFSVLLAPALALRGLDFHALNLSVALWGVACITLIAAFKRSRVGTALALALAAFAWLNPLFQSFCNRLMSDVPATAALFAGFLLERWAQRNPSWRRDALLGVFIALSGYVRWVNALFLAAVLASRITRRWTAGERGGWFSFVRRRLAPVALVTAAAIAPWWVRNEMARDERVQDQVFAHSYFTALFRTDIDDPHSAILAPSAVLQRIGSNLAWIGSGVGGRLRSETVEDAHAAVGAVVLALALVTLARRRGSADFMLLGLVAAYSMAPTLRDRYLLPVLLLAVAGAADALAWLAGRVAGLRPARALLAVLVAALAGFDFRPHQGWQQIETRHRRFVETCAALRARLADDAVVATTVGWHLSVYLQRPVYSVSPAMKNSRRLSTCEEVIDRYRVNTLVAADFLVDSDALEKYLRSKYGQGEQAGEARIYRVRP